MRLGKRKQPAAVATAAADTGIYILHGSSHAVTYIMQLN